MGDIIPPTFILKTQNCRQKGVHQHCEKLESGSVFKYGLKAPLFSFNSDAQEGVRMPESKELGLHWRRRCARGEAGLGKKVIILSRLLIHAWVNCSERYKIASCHNHHSSAARFRLCCLRVQRLCRLLRQPRELFE